MPRPALLVLVRHAESRRNVAKKRNRFFLNDEARKAVKGIPDHRIPLTAEGCRQASITGTALRESFGVFDFGPLFARPPGGESLAQVCERVYSFLQKLARTMAGRRILVVTHGGTLWCFRYVLE